MRVFYGKDLHHYFTGIVNSGHVTFKTINFPADDLPTLSNEVTSTAITDVMPHLLWCRLQTQYFTTFVFLMRLIKILSLKWYFTLYKKNIIIIFFKHVVGDHNKCMLNPGSITPTLYTVISHTGIVHWGHLTFKRQSIFTLL